MSANIGTKLLWVIPFIIFGYIIYMNTPLGSSLHYRIDIGNNDTVGNATLSGPMDRVSAPMEINNTTYRELKIGLVYFNLKSQLLNDASTTHVKVRFKDNFPAENIFKLEPQNKKGWGYLWREIFVPFYENNLTDMELIYDVTPIKIYSTRPQSVCDNHNKKSLDSFSTEKAISNFLDEVPPGTIIATNMKLDSSFANIQEKYNDDLIIDASIRDAHTFYTYIDNGLLNLTVTKQDMNWYKGADELNITVYTSDGTHVGTVIIPDDGIINISDEYDIDQSGTIAIPDLKKGVYKIDFQCGIDLIIKRISINQNKLVVANRLFILNSDKIFTKNYNEREIRFQTFHRDVVPQNIRIKGTSGTQTVNLSKEHEWFNITIKPGDDLYEIESGYGDIIIESNNYFSFTKESFFIPMKYEVKKIQNNIDWINSNGIDYILLDYIPVEKEEDGWMVAQGMWGTEDLKINNNTLNFVFGIPHLYVREYKNNTVPIDWIDITVTVLPLWKRI